MSFIGLRQVLDPPTWGTFYLLSCQDDGTPPYPFDPYEGMLPVYELDGFFGIYLIADSPEDFAIMAGEGALDGEMFTMDEGEPPPPPGEGGTNEWTYEFTPLVFTTNDLWLEITAVSNWVGNFIVHPRFDEVTNAFDLFATLDLADTGPGLNWTNWEWLARTVSLETNLAISNLCCDVALFRVARTNDPDEDGMSTAFENLVSHLDPNNGDENTNGIPDGWEWGNFGSLLPASADYDGDGYDILYEYENEMDPNKIRFFMTVSNYYVSSGLVPLQLTVEGGVPSGLATVVSTNFITTNDVLMAAEWAPYCADLLADIGPVDGRYNLWVGVRGRMPTSQQSWNCRTVVLDTTPPAVTLLCPTNSMLVKPLVQIGGIASEAVSDVSYDLQNGSETNLNVPAYVTATCAATNGAISVSFQCFDVRLTEGTNQFTLRVKDLAGNAATVSETYICDFSTLTSPPVLDVTWPTNNAVLAGESMIVRGVVDDESAIVTAELAASGVVQDFTASVARDGAFEIQNVWLQPGTNTLTVQAVNANELASTQAVTVVRSPIYLAVNPIPSGSLTGATVTVSGTITEADWGVSANGVTATVNGDGTWQANNVPVIGSGAADVTVNVTPPAGNTNDAPAAQLFSQDLPPSIHAGAYRGFAQSDYAGWTEFCGGWFAYPFLDSHDTNFVSWTNSVGGTWRLTASGYNWDLLEWYNEDSSVDLGPDGRQPVEWMDYPIPLEWSDYQMYEPPGYCFHTFRTGTRQTRSSIELFTGGPATMGNFRLYRLKFIAWEFSEVAVSDLLYFWNQTGDLALPPEWIEFRGCPLMRGATNLDGSVWGEAYITAPAGTNVDITPTVKQFHDKGLISFQVEAEEVKLGIVANGVLLDPDNVVSNAEFCVGQKVTFTTNWSSSLAGLESNTETSKWKFDGNYINAVIVRGGSQSDVCTNLPSFLTNNPSSAWWVSGGFEPPVTYKATLEEALTFENGQRVTIACEGKFHMHRPLIAIYTNRPNAFIASPYFVVKILLQLGSNTPNNELAMDFDMVIDSKFYGLCGVQQLCTLNYSNPAGRATNALDNFEWYTDPALIWPGGIAGNSNDISHITLNVHDGPASTDFSPNRLEASYADFIMFRPGFATATNNYYVPIGKVNWDILGVASFHGSSLEIDTNQINNPVCLPASEQFPMWDSVFINP